MDKVLIVDDHAVLRQGIRGILNNTPRWKLCGEADSGESAVRAVANEKPDVIIMDVSMPGMGGLKATQKIHAMLPDVKIVIFTLYFSVELVRAGFAAGATGYVLKSDLEDELLHALDAVANDEYFVTPSLNPVLAGELKQEHKFQRDQLRADREPKTPRSN